MRRIARPVVLFLALGLLAACTSPEAVRQRGGGPGADPGNRPAQVKMHEGSQPYWKTPVRIQPSDGPSLAPAEQARRLSLERPGSGRDANREKQP